MGVYDLHTELLAEKGFADVAFIPKPKTDFRRFPPILVELKYNQTAQTAINQINGREYQRFFESYPNVILVGVSYKKNTKNKKHECVILNHTFS